jgi:biotin carboxyl carrier protein
MTFEVEINGTRTSVAIESVGAVSKDGGAFRVVLRDLANPAAPPVHRDLHAARTDLGLSLIFDDGRQSVDVATTDRAAGECLVQLPHSTIVAVVDGRRFERAGASDTGGTGEQRVTAPMPGRIVRILVKAGDTVSARQGLVVVEAMKMENELTVPRAGRVKEVSVTEGVSVAAGRLLLIVE